MSMFHSAEEWERFAQALESIAAQYYSDDHKQFLTVEAAELPQIILSPREAYYAVKKRVNIEDCRGRIAGEMVVPYPPGIPCVMPGELISPQIYDYLLFLQQSPVRLQGPEDLQLNHLNIIEV
ncbi:hypothetical protein [Syntrophomonas palmitatica]|uniref:Orn/Lys/Arg family decarboxylase n=1 Tax=Syntrophomonas palmitatica TaxID=402877 RepID=UPI001A9A3A30|nr:hypothetical protein [Syntrophomonas palmitatica]